jgi:hypothetical protein
VSCYIDQFFGYVIRVSQYLLPHRIKFCIISGIVKLLKVINFFKLTIKSSSIIINYIYIVYIVYYTTLYSIIINCTIEGSIIY